MTVAWGIRVAAVLLWVNAVGFGMPAVIGIKSMMAGRGIAYIMGYPAYGNGPFERIGIQTTVSLVAAFLLVCVLEAIAGTLLWGGHRSGAVLALVLLPVGALFWWGFALPFPPLFAIVRTLLIALNWKSLTP